MPERMRGDQVFGAAGYPINSDRLMLQEPVPAHAHDFCELAVICAGRARYRTRLGERMISAGDVVAVRPGSWHAYADVDALDVANVYLGADLLTSELGWVLDDPASANLLFGTGELAVRLPADAIERVAGWLAQLADCRVRDAPSAPLQLRSLLGAVFAEFLSVRTVPSVAPAPPSVRSALAAMAERPEHPWSITLLARSAGVSGSHLQHQFTARLGISPLRWLNQYRAERMAVLLVAGDRSVAEAGRSVGWADPNYAARRFRAAYGMPPSRYRARFSFDQSGT